jgi:hypothetical protein
VAPVLAGDEPAVAADPGGAGLLGLAARACVMVPRLPASDGVSYG